MKTKTPVIGLILIVSLALMTGAVSAQPAVNIELQPEQQSLDIGDNASIDVVVTDPVNGVGGYEFFIDISNPDVATITDYSTPNQPALSDTSISADNSSIEFADVMGNNVYSAGDEVVIATLTLDTRSSGETQLSFRDEIGLFDSVGGDYSVNETGTSSIQVSGAYFSVEITEITEKAQPGDTVTATATVTNTGDQSGTQTIELLIDGEAVNSTEISLEQGEEQEIELSGDIPSNAETEVTAMVQSKNEEDSRTITIQTGGGLPLPGLGFTAAVLAVILTALGARARN